MYFSLVVIQVGSVCIAAVASQLLFRVMRWTRYTPVQTLSAMAVTAIVALPIAKRMRHIVHGLVEHSDYFFGTVAVNASELVSCAIVAVIVIFAGKALRRVSLKWQADGLAGDAPAKAAATDEERRIILNTLAAGKVSPQEAEELLKAAGARSPRVERPAARWTMGFIAGTLLVVLGFALPWVYIDSAKLQAGYHQGALGWIILSAGVIPAILMCIPALDRHVQLAYLRLILAGCGIALISPRIPEIASWLIGLYLGLVFGGGDEYMIVVFGLGNGFARSGPGIFMVLLGFAVQFVSAAIQSGILRPRPR